MRKTILLLILAAVGRGEENVVTWTGWFSDLSCATNRVSGGDLSSTNPECSRTCIKKGTPPAFISEQTKSVFTVKSAAPVVDELGFHVQIECVVDGKTVEIRKITRLGYDGAACGRPKKKS